jgi:hypothetical protein
MKEIKGFGKGKGKLVHAITTEGTLLCDGRRQMAIDEGVTEATCKFCLQHGVYKAHVGWTDGVLPPVEEEKPKEKKKPAAKKQPKPKVDVEKKKPKPKPKKKEEVKPEEKPDPPPEAFIPEIIGDSINIVHAPTKTRMFNQVPVEIINIALGFMNTIPDEWAGGSPPEGYISLCREAYRAAYEEIGMDPPPNLNTPLPSKKKTKKKKAADKPKKERKLKRRPKKEEKPKRTLKRRKKKDEKPKKKLKKRREEKLYGIFVPGRAPYTIAAMVKSGSYVGDIVRQLVEKHKMDPKKAERRVHSTIKNMMVKKAGLTVLCFMQPAKEFWFYKVEKLEKED